MYNGPYATEAPASRTEADSDAALAVLERRLGATPSTEDADMLEGKAEQLKVIVMGSTAGAWCLSKGLTGAWLHICRAESIDLGDKCAGPALEDTGMRLAQLPKGSARWTLG